MTFIIKSNSFEGPLDLLLDLIEKRKLFISDISLAKVTDDFIDHIKHFDNIPISESAHFILIASTLLLIKSKSLLPDLTLTLDEEENISDLEMRLKIYNKIKEASVHVNKLFGEQIIFPQSHTKTITSVFAPDPNFSIEKALYSLKDLINRLPKKEKLPQVIVRKVMSLEDMIDTLTLRITSHLRMSFRDFTKDHKEDRVNVIVSFLAMLELVKQGTLMVTQESNFADIQMETKEVGVPRY